MNFIYIADPMCSWCYGFSQTIDQLMRDSGPHAPMKLAVLMGGLRPDQTDAITTEQVNEILSHWDRVEAATGLPFERGTQAAIRQPGFVYNTEPASRAVVLVRKLWPHLVWKFLRAIQHGFYAEGRDITQVEVLAAVGQTIGINPEQLIKGMSADLIKQQVREDFAQVQQAGIQGFPMLLAQWGDELHAIQHGYCDLDELKSKIQVLASRLSSPSSN